MFSEDDFAEIPNTYRKIVTNTANHALAKSTWDSYKSSLRRLKDCERETGTPMNLPLEEREVILFIAFLIEKELAASTIESYLSGLRQAHIAGGWGDRNLRSSKIKQILKGRKNQILQVNKGQKRLPITPTIMTLMKCYLKKQKMDNKRKLLVWAIATCAFAGGFRIHELLPQNGRSFDPNKTLLWRDIQLKQVKIEDEELTILQICLKTEKTRKSKGHTIVDIYESRGVLCPIRAFKKWSESRQRTKEDLPAFLDEEGANFTGRRFNGFLRAFQAEKLPNIQGSISSHSFRAGLATMLGSLGFSDEDIKSTGRWSSRAFLEYLKLPRSRRAEMAKEIAKLKL